MWPLSKLNFSKFREAEIEFFTGLSKVRVCQSQQLGDIFHSLSRLDQFEPAEAKLEDTLSLAVPLPDATPPGYILLYDLAKKHFCVYMGH